MTFTKEQLKTAHNKVWVKKIGQEALNSFDAEMMQQYYELRDEEFEDLVGFLAEQSKAAG